MIGSRIPVLFAVFCAMADSAVARPFNQLWVFGDSTVGSGWYREKPYSGEANYDFYIKQSAAAVGRPTSSPGPMSVEVLGAALGVTARPENQDGTDYGTGGARDFLPNTATSGGFPNAVPTQAQLIKYMYVHERFIGQKIRAARNLYAISSGGNDVAFAIKNISSTNDATNYVTHAADTPCGNHQAALRLSLWLQPCSYCRHRPPQILRYRRAAAIPAPSQRNTAAAAGCLARFLCVGGP